MLKEYFTRESHNHDFPQPLISCSVVTVLEEKNSPELSVNDEEIMIHYNVKQKKSYLNVKYSEELSQIKLKELKYLVFQF